MSKLKELEKRLRDEPENIGLRITVAGVLREVGRRDEAIDLYRSVAMAYREQGRTQQAIAVCRSILEFAPDDARSQALLVALAPSTAAQVVTAVAELPSIADTRLAPRLPTRRSTVEDLAAHIEPEVRAPVIPTSEHTPLPKPMPYHLADPTTSHAPKVSAADMTADLDEATRIREPEPPQTDSARDLTTVAAEPVRDSALTPARLAPPPARDADRDSLTTTAARDALPARDSRDALPARDSRDARDALPARDSRDARDALPARDSRDARDSEAPPIRDTEAQLSPPTRSSQPPSPPPGRVRRDSSGLAAAARRISQSLVAMDEDLELDTREVPRIDDATEDEMTDPRALPIAPNREPALDPTGAAPRVSSSPLPAALPPPPTSRTKPPTAPPRSVAPYRPPAASPPRAATPASPPAAAKSSTPSSPPRAATPASPPAAAKSSTSSISPAAAKSPPRAAPAASPPRAATPVSPPAAAKFSTPSSPPAAATPASPPRAATPSSPPAVATPSSPPAAAPLARIAPVPRVAPAVPSLRAKSLSQWPALIASPFFGPLPADQRAAVFARFAQRTVATGDIIIQQGEAAHALFLVARGRLEVRIERAGGFVTLGSIVVGEVAGEASLLARAPSRTQIVAATGADVLSLGPRDALALLDAYPAIAAALKATADQRDRNYADKLTAL
ncbi:MAG TPA: cyclic nucleotide-binding domain-containing protein [Kofleriaceae bacterium]